MFRFLYAFLCMVMLSACTGTAYQLPDVTSEDITAMENKISGSKKQIALYERSDDEYKALLTKITKRLTKNAKPLCDHAGYDNCYFHVTYDPDDVFNAYASEGYKIVAYRGLLQHLETEEEIAAVIAHEMGHHLAKHNHESEDNIMTGMAVAGVLTAVLIGVSSANNPYYYNSYQQYQDQRALENMMNLGASIGAISYSKEQEREADLLATYLLDRAGYDLKKSQSLMMVMAQFSGESMNSRAAFLDTHPASIERFVAWEKAMEEVKTNDTKLPYLKQE